MKNKILTFIIGLLLGAIITTTGFFIYIKTISNNSAQPERLIMNEKGQWEYGQPGDMSEPPEKPSGEYLYEKADQM